MDSIKFIPSNLARAGVYQARASSSAPDHSQRHTSGLVQAGEDGCRAGAAIEVNEEILATDHVHGVKSACPLRKIVLVLMKPQLWLEKSASSVMAREIRDEKTPAAPKTVAMHMASPISGAIRIQGSLACLRHAQMILINVHRLAIPVPDILKLLIVDDTAHLGNF